MGGCALSDSITLHPDDAREIANGESFTVAGEDFEYVTSQEVSRHRWYVKRLIVFKHDGALRGLYYLDPATEMQEGGDEFEADPVPVFKVQAREIKTTVYEAA